MIKSETLGQNAQNQRLFLIIAAPTKLVKYKIPVSKEPSPPRACTKGETAPYDTPPYEHAAGLFPRNANKGQHGELSDAMRNFRNNIAEANACTKGEGVPYDTPPYEHAAGLFPRTKIPKTFCKSFTVWSFIHRLYGLRTKSAYNRGGHREYDQHKLRCHKRDKS